MRAYVGVGANLGDREATIREAVRLLGDEVVAVSRLRETEPWGYADQPPFLNGAILLETGLEPRALLDRLLAVERELGRSRDGPRYGPRTIDLDLLLYGDRVVDEPGLTVPHPRLHERA
ncbi:MAG TPA: 2-amino-4-hydroxy-6-hydroxymethyldihydropteridine diphosphokinase, partial [Gaiellaceae bacterium]